MTAVATPFEPYPLFSERRRRSPQQREPSVLPVRLAFVGVGHIGRRRLRALLDRDDFVVAALCDPHTIPRDALAAECRARGAEDVVGFAQIDDLLRHADRLALDGVVIATPTPVHAEQAIRALDQGLAVFCQPPLSRSCGETRDILRAAARADRLLGVDFSYRGVAGIDDGRMLCASGALGTVHAIDLVFHCATGPRATAESDHAMTNGGCVRDLGAHLVDWLLSMLPDETVTDVRAQRYAQGERLRVGDLRPEDQATAFLTLASGATARLSCAWWAHTGCEAVIDAVVYGTRGAVRLHNRNGSVLDLVVEHHEGNTRRILETPDQRWGARELARWVHGLARGARYDAAAAAQYFATARVLDRIIAQ
jgi:predicted dehydrogenase